MNRKQAEQLRLDNRHWKLGVIYSCKNDPRVIVRNRWLFGWTWNFGNPYVFIVLPGFVAAFLAPILFISPMINASVNELIVMYIYIVVILIMISVAHYIA
jgi:hypothetical protein